MNEVHDDPQEGEMSVEDVRGLFPCDETDSFPPKPKDFRINFVDYVVKHFGKWYLPGNRNYCTYSRDLNGPNPSKEALLWNQVLSWLGTFEECVSLLTSTHPHLSETQKYLQYHEWIHNVLRMQRQIRYGVFRSMKLYDADEYEILLNEVGSRVNLSITADGRRLDETGALLPPITGRECPGLPTPVHLGLEPYGGYEIHRGLFYDAYRSEMNEMNNTDRIN